MQASSQYEETKKKLLATQEFICHHSILIRITSNRLTSAARDTASPEASIAAMANVPGLAVRGFDSGTNLGRMLSVGFKRLTYMRR